MALINTKKSALFLKAGAALPTPPANFLETTDPVLISPEFQTEDIDRMSGELNAKDTYNDLCRTSVSFAAVHAMRAAGEKASEFDKVPEYGQLLIVNGFTETVTGTAADGNVTYVNNTDTVEAGSGVVVVDGNKFEMTNALASSLEIDLTVGKVATLTASMQGYLDSPIPTVVPQPSVTLSDEPLLVVSCADIYMFDGTVIPTESVKITTNPDIQELYTMGGASGLKRNFTSDYSLQLEATFFVDAARYDVDPTNIESEDMKEIIVGIGLDGSSNEINGKSVEFKASLAKTITYSDTTDKDLLKRTVTFRLMNSATPGAALTIKHGFFA